jgi:mannosidase alpha-like ER degradation enhancer 2
VHRDQYYVEVHMQTGAVVWPLVNSLGNFWPGLLTLAGEARAALVVCGCLSVPVWCCR